MVKSMNIGRKQMLMNEVGIYRDSKGKWYVVPSLSHRGSIRSSIQEIGSTMRAVMHRTNG